MSGSIDTLLGELDSKWQEAKDTYRIEGTDVNPLKYILKVIAHWSADSHVSAEFKKEGLVSYLNQDGQNPIDLSRLDTYLAHIRSVFEDFKEFKGKFEISPNYVKLDKELAMMLYSAIIDGKEYTGKVLGPGAYLSKHMNIKHMRTKR